MALQFYLGRAGSGKSRALYERLIKQSIEEKNFSFMAVVPEQYSMETQKQIMELHPNHGSTNIEVTSFNRLAPNIAGIARKNVNSAAAVLDTPNNNAPTIVAPEREVPGKIAAIN